MRRSPRQLGGRGVHRAPPVDDASAQVLEQPPVAGACRDRDERARGLVGIGTTCSSRRSRSKVCACMFAISTFVIVPRATARESARPGSSVWTWTLSAVGSPTTRSESPSGSSSRSSSSASSRSPSTTKAVQYLNSERCGAATRRSAPAARRQAAPERGSLEHAHNAAQDLEQPCCAGVDNARLCQHGQQLARPPNAVVAARDDRREVPAGLRFLGELTDRGQHRPLDRLAHCAVGGVARGAKGARKIVRDRERVRGAADDLREDHARVSACPHERRPRDLVCERRPLVGLRGLERLDDGTNRQREVRPRVAVGHGIDVKVVDTATRRLYRRQPAAGEIEDARPHAVTRTSSTTTSTDSTGRPVSRSRS